MRVANGTTEVIVANAGLVMLDRVEQLERLKKFIEEAPLRVGSADLLISVTNELEQAREAVLDVMLK